MLKEINIVHYNIQNCGGVSAHQHIHAVLLIKSNIDQTLHHGLGLQCPLTAEGKAEFNTRF